MVYEDIGPLEPPKTPSLWQSDSAYSVSWKVRDHWHSISADCVEKPSSMSSGTTALSSHSWFGMNMVLSGKGHYQDQHDHRHPLAPGVIYQRIPDQLHAVHIDSDCNWCEVYISMRARTFEHLFDLGLIRDCPVYYLKHPEIIVNQYKDILGLMDQAHSARVPNILLAIQQLFIRIHENAERDWDPDPYRKVIAEACEVLDCHLDEDIDIEELSEHIGVSYETFRKAFKERLGIAPGAYRVRKRIERGCVLLRKTEMPVNIIAEKLGYSDGFTFSAQFKKIIGTAPSIYRQGRS